MTLLLLCFLIGAVSGLRALTPPAVVCWGAWLGWLHFAGTGLGFIDHTVTLVIFSLLALGEIVNDKLPKTPARTSVAGIIPRVLFGGCCAAALAVSASGNLIVAVILGVIGALAGTFAGYNVRHALVTRANLPDLGVALVEDLVAIAGGFLIVSRL